MAVSKSAQLSSHPETRLVSHKESRKQDALQQCTQPLVRNLQHRASSLPAHWQTHLIHLQLFHNCICMHYKARFGTLRLALHYHFADVNHDWDTQCEVLCSHTVKEQAQQGRGGIQIMHHFAGRERKQDLILKAPIWRIRLMRRYH